jgi:tetratricopeptide (TPR) repeat protein
VNAKEERPHIQRKNEDSGDKRGHDKRGQTPFSPFPVSVRRLWLFRVITIVVTPILLLVMLEVALRVAGYGFPASTFIKYEAPAGDEANGKTLYCSNSKFGWWFFPREIARQFEPFVVPAEKSADTYRIFVLGESAAQGDPEPSYGFSRQLAVMLRQEYPSVNFEVFNASMTAINSHAIVKITEDCARLRPDLFIVYAGNNEVVGPYGAGTVFSPLSKSLFLIRASIAIKATRTGQLMARLANVAGRRAKAHSARTTPETWGGLEMFLGKQIRRDDERMRYVYSHFRSNLEDIIRIAQKSGAKVILSTVAVNLKDCPPFASLNREGLDEQQKKSFDALYQSGIELEKTGDFNDALEKYLDAAKIDDTYAQLQFRLGRCLWNLGQFDHAGKSYALAKELDTLRFRADSSVNGIIREVSRQKLNKDVYFVDAAGAFEANSPHNCPGFELFLEHVHPVFAGNYLLAKTVFDEVEQILPEKFKALKTQDAAIASEQLVAQRLAFTIYDNLRVTRANLQNISTKQPYINQAYHEEMADFWKQKVEQLTGATSPAARVEALKQYQLAISQNGADRDLRINYALLLMEDKSNAVAAFEQYRRIVELVPHDYHTLVDLATFEAAGGKLDSALKHALAAVRYMPTEPTANYTAGAVYQMMRQYEKAQRYLAESVRLNPKLGLGYSNLAAVLGMQGEIDRAEDTLRKGIEMLPDNAQLRFALAGLLRQKGLLEESESQRRKAIELDPNLASVGKQQGRP